MARKRQPPPAERPKRDYAAAYARRNARARAQGYESYYDYRVRGQSKGTPSTPRATGEKLARLRGHVGPGDLARDARDGDYLVAGAVVWHPQSRAKVGLWERRVRITVTRIDTQGRSHEYVLHGRRTSRDRSSAQTLVRRKLEQLVATLEKRGVTFSPAPSQDLRRMAASPGDE